MPLPRQGLEVRADGLWAELWCETPLEHWTYGLEAFGVRVDDELPRGRGRVRSASASRSVSTSNGRSPAPAHPHGAEWPRAGYVVPGIVHGEVLLGRSRFELDARW